MSKVIPNFSNYSVNAEGQIFNKFNKQLSAFNNGRNYKQVRMVNDNGETKSLYVHRVVLTAFVGECPDGHNADHVNSRSDDNRLSNLRWTDKDFNFTCARKPYKKRESVSQELRKRVIELLSEGKTAYHIEKLTGVNHSNVYNIRYASRKNA